MSLHHWLEWLAFCLAWLWLGQTLQRPLPEPVAIAAFDDGYLIPREFRVAGEMFPDREAKTDACLWSSLNGEAGRTIPSLAHPGPEPQAKADSPPYWEIYPWHFPAIHFGRAPPSERPVRLGPFLTRCSPALRCNEFFVDLVGDGLASMYPASRWSVAPGHHGYQRACDLVSG